MAGLALLGGPSFASRALLIAGAKEHGGRVRLVSALPDWMQPFIQALPLTALNDALRAVINDGAPVASQWHEVAVLVAWGVIPFPIALKLFRWQ